VIQVQRVRAGGAQRPFAFPFAFVAGLPLFFLATAGRVGFDDFVAGFADFTGLGAGFAGAAAFAGLALFGAGAATTGTTGFGGGAAGGRDGARELVLSGGRGCFRGRPLFRAAWPSAISLSNAALASASNLACCELRDVWARSFSALKRSSGRMRISQRNMTEQVGPS
jgi:hypothetical protein